VLLACALPLAAWAGVAAIESASASSTSTASSASTASASASASVAPAAPSGTAGWSTVFRDDFSGRAGSALNTKNWLYDTGTGYPGGAANWGTGEVESFTASTANVHLDGQGHLVITPLRDASGHWTSGRVETRRTDFAAPVGGEMELAASIKQPNPASGLGYWPAFWALGADSRPAAATNWPKIGELDVMEDVNAQSKVASTLHCGTDPGGPCNETNGIGSGLLACNGCQTGYHTYAVIVDRRNPAAEQIRFTLDGRQTFAINESQVGTATWQAAIDHGFYAIFNLAIGGAFPNAVCGCTSPSAATTPGASMSVDWFAVYQKR
jgi:beta-glucanase (GH16 family)